MWDELLPQQSHTPVWGMPRLLRPCHEAGGSMSSCDWNRATAWGNKKYHSSFKPKVVARGCRGETFKNSSICAVMQSSCLYICDKITELNQAKKNIAKIAAYITISYHVITDEHHRNAQLRHHEKGNETTRQHYQAENSQPKRMFSPQIQTVWNQPSVLKFIARK